MSTNQTLDQIKKSTTRGDQHLGDIVFWGLQNADVDRATLEARWADAALDKNLLPELPSPEKTLRLATKEASLGQPSLLLRRSLESDTEIAVAVVRETKHEDAKPTYETEAIVRLDRAAGTLSSATPDHVSVKALTAAYDRMHGNHTTEDVRKLVIVTLASLAAVPLRESGGVYWVPTTNADPLRRLQTCIEKFGSSAFYLVPVHEGEDASRALGDAATRSLEEELVALQDEMKDFAVEKPRKDTLTRRLETFGQLRQRAELYRAILSVQVGDLTSSITTLEAQANEMLVRIEPTGTP